MLLLIICLVTAEAKERFLKVWPFSGGKYLISEKLQTNWFVIHTQLWFTGAVLFWAKQASWILFTVVSAPPFEVSQAFFGSGFQSVCKLIWAELLGGVNMVWQLSCWIPWGGKLWLSLDPLVHSVEFWAAERAVIYPWSSAQLPSVPPHWDGVENSKGKRERICELGSGQPNR